MEIDDTIHDPSIRSRNWVFTYNNYDDDVCSKLEGWTDPSWIVFGREIAPTTGTPHLQGAFIFKNAQRWSSLMKFLHFSYLAPMKGQPHHSLEYCSKVDEFFYQRGECPGPKGKKGGEANAAKWAQTKELAMAGRIDEIDPQHYVQFYGNLVKIKAAKQTRPIAIDGVCGVWFYGDTGVGKSRAARDEFPEAFLKGPTKWFDGYQNEDAVIIEDLDPKHEYMGYHLKIWADRYPFPAEIKGSTICIRPKHIVVTSNYHPRQIWSDIGILDPILRRFKITHFKQLISRDGRPLESSRDSDEVRHAYVPGFVPPGQKTYEPEIPAPIVMNPLAEEGMFTFEL